MCLLKNHTQQFSRSQANSGKKDKATRQDIPVSENIYGGMSSGELMEAREKELELAQQDQTMEETKNRKNALESYVYDTRNKVLWVDDFLCYFRDR